MAPADHPHQTLDADPPAQPRSLRFDQIDQALALTLLRSGQVEVSRYLELCRWRGWDPQHGMRGNA